MTSPSDISSAALVLGSGGARAAYEVGVARFLFEDLPVVLGHAPDLRIFCGTSAGALNACALAAFAHAPLEGVTLLARRWTEMRLDDMVRPDKCEILRLARALLGRPSRRPASAGSLLDARPFLHLAHGSFPFARIEEAIVDGSLEALALGTTEVATGHSNVFVRRRRQTAKLDPTMVEVRPGDLRPEHALASSAIPLLFPAVDIDGALFCDGSLRQSVPLSPAHHLGADRMVVVTTQHRAPAVSPWLAQERARSADSPLYMLGKAVNALHLDRIDDDLDRLGMVNDLLAAGQRVFGGTFLERLNRELVTATGRVVSPLRAALVRPSESLGRLAADYVTGRAFRRRKGAVASAFARLADVEAEHEADLVSYLLFDGPFAQELIELGHADARAASDQIAALFSEQLVAQAALRRSF